MTMTQSAENQNRKIQAIKDPGSNSEVENMVSGKKKNALDGLRIRYEMAGERIGELKDRSIAMIKFEESKNINRK